MCLRLAYEHINSIYLSQESAASVGIAATATNAVHYASSVGNSFWVSSACSEKSGNTHKHVHAPTSSSNIITEALPERSLRSPPAALVR